jgi:hypothetical protein
MRTRLRAECQALISREEERPSKRGEAQREGAVKTVAKIPLLLIGLPSASKQKKVIGEIGDPAAFAKVGSYPAGVAPQCYARRLLDSV